MADDRPCRNKIPGTAGGAFPYDGELVSSILLDDCDSMPMDLPRSASLKPGQPFYSYDGAASPFSTAPLFGADLTADGGTVSGSSGAQSSTRHSARHLAPHHRADGEAPNRTPTRTPSPVYQWNHSKTGAEDTGPAFQVERPGKSSSSTNTGTEHQGSSRHSPSVRPDEAGPLFPQMPFPPFMPPYWGAAFNPQAQDSYAMMSDKVQEAYYGMMMNNPAAAAAAASAQCPQGDGKVPGPMDPNMWQMMMAMQAPAMASVAAAVAQNQTSPSSASSDSPPPLRSNTLAATTEEAPDVGHDPAPGSRGGGGGAAEGKRTKSRNKDTKDKDVLPARPTPEAAAPRERGPGAKAERRRRGGGAGAGTQAVGDGGSAERAGAGGGKSRALDSRAQSSNPMVEQLKAKDRNIDLSDLAVHISEIAQDQYGSRLIQQKLEVASDEEKQVAFKSVLQKMPQLTTDVFGNYVIQKFFEYGNAEQRRILAEQLVGQVLKLSLQMYGCRVVQKALDSVPIDQQVLLIGELKGHVIKCIEDQHGNHVIQKCIERLPTDRIGFIVESFLGQASRMAKHCYGCRVIQRLIEYCVSAQISPLLDEVLHYCTELATDQYGNYVVQHVMEHSSRPGDRQTIMHIVRQNILTLACHKYASNVIEKALACGTYEERALLIYAIVGEQGDSHPPLLTMMRDRFGNYIVQKVIPLAQGPQRDALLWKLHEHMPALKKSNKYGKHIISALERSQAGIRD